MHKLIINCGKISYNDRNKLCHALIAEGFSFEENNESNNVVVNAASLGQLEDIVNVASEFEVD